jgi:hypothetical protein
VAIFRNREANHGARWQAIVCREGQTDIETFRAQGDAQFLANEGKPIATTQNAASPPFGSAALDHKRTKAAGFKRLIEVIGSPPEY